MEEYTKEQAIQECYEIWKELSKLETYREIDFEQRNLWDLKIDLASNLNKELKENYGCPCCLYNRVNKNSYCGDNCLLNWTLVPFGRCGKEYYTWVRSISVEMASENAKIILELIRQAAEKYKVKLEDK